MPLNYSKWDQLELSDDSDIEGHPNVDKKSLIRWKQRDIHEKREARKARIASLQAEIACNDVLIPRLSALSASILSAPNAQSFFNETVEKLQKNPSSDAPPTNHPNQITYDSMVLSLLLKVAEDVKNKNQNEGIGEALKEAIDVHVVEMGKRQENFRKELIAEEKEQKKHITSDDLHDGFDSKYVPAQPAPPPVPGAKIDKPKAKTKQTEIEVLNPKNSTPATSAPEPDTDDEGDETLPTLTPSLTEFSKLPLKGYQVSWDFISSHRDVIVPGASDALLVEAFRAQSRGENLYAKKCVHQSLLLQYCEKLGGDGVRVFFRKMTAGDRRAETVFTKDVEDTYSHLATRVAASKAEEAASAGQEQIQLVPENPSQSITFNVPSGPPPENLVLEGPGTEDLDVEEVRKALQMRWDVFEGFSDDMKDALKDGTLGAVNKVLGNMPVETAEEVVRLLDVGGILSFAEGGIRDETGKLDEDEAPDGEGRMKE